MWENSVCFERVHGGYSFGDRNKEGDAILEFTMAYDQVLTNTYFIKDSYFITFKCLGIILVK